MNIFIWSSRKSVDHEANDRVKVHGDGTRADGRRSRSSAPFTPSTRSGERAEAKVAALMEKVAELNATVGELKGENKVLREHSERLFAMLEARPKQ